MKAARLRNRLEFQGFTEVDDGTGGAIKTWHKEKTVWGELLPDRARAREAINAGQEISSKNYKAVIRYTNGITEDMRIVWDEKTFNITAPPMDMDGRKKQLTIDCTAHA